MSTLRDEDNVSEVAKARIKVYKIFFGDRSPAEICKLPLQPFARLPGRGSRVARGSGVAQRKHTLANTRQLLGKSALPVHSAADRREA